MSKDRDAYGRPTVVDSVNLAYDALNRMTEQDRSGVYTQIIYAPTGQKLAIMTGQTLQKAFVPLPSGGQAVYNSSGLLYYAHPDHLGSTRFASTPSRTMYFDTAYAPFGEPYAESGTPDLSFTGQRQDTVAGLYDFPAREYSIQGRWPSPDPAGLAAVDLSNPQSWNRYAYVLNNPLAYVDPLGMNDCAHTSGDCGTVVLDGTVLDVSGWFGRSLLNFLSDSGAAAQCPNNNCTGIQATQGPGGTTILQQWIPTQTWTTGDAVAGYAIHQIIGYWQTVGTSSGSGSWNTFWNLWSAYWRGVPWSATVTFTPVAVPISYIPKTNTVCIGFGPAAGVSLPDVPVTVNGGPLVYGDLNNAKDVLSGFSISYGLQPTPGIGWQHTFNNSGRLLGPTTGPWGGNIGVTYSGCKDF